MINIVIMPDDPFEHTMQFDEMPTVVEVLKQLAKTAGMGNYYPVGKFARCIGVIANYGFDESRGYVRIYNDSPSEA